MPENRGTNSENTRSLLQDVLTLIFPSLCVECDGRVRGGPCRSLCLECLEDVFQRQGKGGRCWRCARYLGPGTVDKKECQTCRGQEYSFGSAFAFARYHDPVKSWVKQAKYGREPVLAADLGKLLGRSLVEHPNLPELDRVVPVPLRPWREVKRGFNQAALAARACAGVLDLPMSPDLLRKTRRTPRQASLGRSMRLQNLSPSDFKVTRPGQSRGARILLVDDVMTTGSTLNACSEALFEAGADTVSVAVIAR